MCINCADLHDVNEGLVVVADKLTDLLIVVTNVQFLYDFNLIYLWPTDLLPYSQLIFT